MPRRTTIHLPNVAHRAPIPMGCKIGSLVYSSALSGHDPVTGKLPEDAPSQAKNLFLNIRRFMEISGGTTDDIIRMSLYLREEGLRDAINTEWTAMFPDPDDRPARHALTTALRGGFLFQAEIVAVLD